MSNEVGLPDSAEPEAVELRMPQGDDLLRWHECERKQKFAQFGEADEAAQATMLRSPVRNDGRNAQVSAYECRWCDGFHIGGTPNRLPMRQSRHRIKKAERLWRKKNGSLP